jgi:hypothetical protein
MKNYLYQLFGAALVFGFCAGLPCAVGAATTFPVDQAGIGAYVKLNSLSPANFENAKSVLFDSVESFGDTYMIGKKEYASYTANDMDYGKTNFHIYLGADGWLAAYLLDDEEPSRIVNWNAANLSDTMLKFIIDDAIEKIGSAASGKIKYYDFSNPQATKMTFVKEITVANDVNESGEMIRTDDFSLTLPGTLYQPSWTIMGMGTSCPMGGYGFPVNLYIDDDIYSPLGGGCNVISYGNYDVNLLNDRASHKIRLEKHAYDVGAAAVTVLLYSVN